MILFVLRLETALALIMAWAFVFLVPLRWTQALFGGVSAPAESSGIDPRSLIRAQAVTRRVVHVADRLPWHSTCLVRAVAGSLLLARRRICGGCIRFGVRKENDRLSAHAWLLLGSDILLGGEEAGAYTPLADLGRRTGGRTT